MCLIPFDGKSREPRSEEFDGFLRTLTVGEGRGVSKARATSLQFPSVHYFALFLGKCLIAREQGSALAAPDFAILRRALHNDNTYNLGAIIACRLHTNRTRGKIHGGIYATRLARRFNVNICPHDYLLPRVYLDHQSMRDHHFLDAPEPPHHIRYNLIFSEDTRDIISLPAPALFDSHARNGYTVMPPDIVAYRNALVAAEDGAQDWDARVPLPQYFHMGPDGYYEWS